MARKVVGSVRPCRTIAPTMKPVTRMVRYMSIPKPRVYATVSATVLGAPPLKMLRLWDRANSTADTHATVNSRRPAERIIFTTMPR